MAALDLFIRRLQSATLTQNVFNPWHQDDPLDYDWAGWPARVDRLRAHFDCQPKFVLIGEAPGYQGCRFSGVPFTSERLIVERRVPRVGTGAGGARITRRPLAWSEPSATIVWNALWDLGIAHHTVMWNAFPWHPHRHDEIWSNRRPTEAEIGDGVILLTELLDHFAGAQVVAVGRVAENLLKSIGRTCVAVRHPANGGATLLRDGLRGLV